jgi:hypothetical protein
MSNTFQCQELKESSERSLPVRRTSADTSRRRLFFGLEAGDPIIILAGEHVGCFELLGTDRIRGIRDLKGRTVAVPALDPSPYAFLASMAAYTWA